jgi:hypothetical protein
LHIALDRFGGIAPAVDPEALADHMAQTARNCRLSSGKLVPLRRNSVVSELGAVGHKGLYRWEYDEHKLTCGTAGSTTVSAWKALTNPGFKISIDGTEYSIAPTFSAATDMAGIAVAIQTKLREETEGIERVEWATNKFIFWCNGEVTALSAPDSGADISGASWLNGLVAAATLDNAAKESWLTWANDVDVVRSSVASDQYSRIYWTGDGKPKVRGYDAGTTKTFDLAIPKPDRAPLVEAAPQLAFDDIKWYVETAGAAPSAAGTSFSAWERDGRKITASATFSSSSLVSGQEYRFVVKVHCTDCDGGPKWVYCNRVQSFAYNKVFNSINYPMWEEDLANGTDHDDADTEIAKKDSGVRVSPTMTVNTVWQKAQLLDPLSPEGGYAITIKFNATITLEGSFSNNDKAFPRYCYAYVTEWGEEGPVGEASGELVVEDGEVGKVWMPVQLPTGGADRGIVTKRVYQTDGAGDWRFVADVPVDDPSQSATINASVKGSAAADNGVLTWEYALAEKSYELLGEVLEPDVLPPDDALAGLCRLPGGYFAAFKGREVWISLAYRPEAWPEGYRFAFHDEIVAIKASGNELFVLTEKTPWLLSGSEPQYMTQTQIMHDERALAKRGVAQVRSLVLSPGPDGLSAFLGGGASVATKGLFDAPTWNGITPASLLAAGQDGAYVGFHSEGALLLDFGEGANTATTADDTGITALYRDDETDSLYAIDAAGDLVIWSPDNGTARSLVWRSREFVLPRPARWVVAQVRASAYGGAVRLRLYGDGLLRGTYVPTDGQARKIPVHGRCLRWSLEVESTATVYEIAAASSMAEVRNG